MRAADEIRRWTWANERARRTYYAEMYCACGRPTPPREGRCGTCRKRAWRQRQREAHDA